MVVKLSDNRLIAIITIVAILSISICFYFIIGSKRNEPEQNQTADSDTESNYYVPFFIYLPP
jgi:flagellar basal body-associated protein FliL